MPVTGMPEPGHVVFHAVCRPALPADDYELRVSQQLIERTGANAGQRLDRNAQQPLPGAQVYPFRVDGPRFTLDASLIHAVFPPTNGRGSYVSRLPMVVLRRRTIPWERQLAPGGALRDTPWVAVLLFEEAEVTTISPCTVDQILDGGDPAKRGPVIAGVDAASRALPCIGIECALELFRDIAPMLDELPMLSHVRQVNTDDKELMGLDDDGWFAVVVGNRLPAPGKRYTACLVSMEGMQALLPTAAETAPVTFPDRRIDDVTFYTELATRRMATALIDDDSADVEAVTQGLIRQMLEAENAYAHLTVDPATSPTSSISSVSQSASNRWRAIEASGGKRVRVLFEEPTVRLFCLAQWKFECLEGGDFEAIMQALPDRGGVAMLGMPPALAQAPGNTPAAAWTAALDTGHVPLEHLTRDGERTMAWYRGPLTSVAVTRGSEGPFHTADQARRLDPATGLENLGYAAAFEIGRLLALGDPRFALDLLRWRRGDRALVDVRVTFDVLNTFAATLSRDIRFEREMLMRVPSFLSTAGNVRFGTVMQRPGNAGLGVLRDPTGLSAIRARLPGLAVDAISASRGYEPLVIKSLIEGVVVGGGAILDTLGVGRSVTLERDIDVLANTASTHFGPLSDRFTAGLRDLTRQGQR